MGKTILVADKSITIQKIVQLTFADEDFEVQCVSDGQAALDSIAQIRPDLILADISLPLKSGYDLCSDIRTDPVFGEFSQLPIILLAGIYETMDEERSRQVEERVQQVRATDFLSKPFDPQVLIVKVKEAIQGVSDVAPETSAPAVTESSGSEQENIFTPVTESSTSFSETLELPDEGYESNEEAEVPDDNETTVMIPGGVFRENMFAEPLPYEDEQEKESPEEASETAASAEAGESVLDEQEFQDLGEEVVDNLESTQQVEPVEGESDQVQETTFEVVSGLEELEEPEAKKDTPSLIVTETDDPFGEVFSTPGSVSWASSVEEEAPFELPMPAPEILETAVPEAGVPEEQREEVPAVSAVPEEKPVAKREDYDDTWPGLQESLEHPVEDLFEQDTVSELEEEAEETIAPEPDDEEEGAVSVTGESSGQAEITDDLVNRVADVVLARLSERIVSEIVWQVVPDLAEKMIRREIEKLHSGEE